ncbi:EscU/YscU/HrcU family type III secretion system export apparatus switch protein [Pontivivens ytuae]|uniref:Flagellar biosynthesis protein FlhB n=1 Tax=Pontivivens ytuae TaxID=2789856 RepID=A0A7S9LPV5_9RHOB|nr:flagellar type III secretion system protein FlhB [Pontivivens ytuae]QPH53094.1 flagellar biosynthesis protein FlhB [Pontivivens ytuae]
MSEQNDQGEKSHEPTQKRLDTAREDGNIAQAPDLTATAAYAGLFLVILAAGPALVRDVGAALTAPIAHADAPGEWPRIEAYAKDVAWGLAPLFLAPVAAVLAVLAATRAVTFAPKKIAPDLSRISPIAGAKNKFGPTGLFEFAKSSTKLTVISIAVGLWFTLRLDRIVGLSAAEAPSLLVEIGQTVRVLLIVVLGITVPLAVLDMLWQRFDHRRKLRMSHQDLKDEAKQAEGDPHAKSQRRRRAQELAGNRMLQDVPDADVVIVNPIHIAVALKWDRGRGGAPVCVAKGQGEIAERIRERAAEHGVPIHRDIATARSLHATVEIGAEVPRDTYRAVAAAIRFADHVRRKAK